MSNVVTRPVEQTGQDFSAAVAAAKSEIELSVERGGLRDDPFRFPLAALATTLGIFPELVAQIRKAAASGSQVLSPEALSRIEAIAAERAAQAIEREAKSAVQTNRIRSNLLVGGIVSTALFVGSMSGFWWGYSAGSEHALNLASGLQDVLRRDPKSATEWLRLMQSNDIGKALAACKGERINTTSDGQRSCALPVWLDPAPTNLPKG